MSETARAADGDAPQEEFAGAVAAHVGIVSSACCGKIALQMIDAAGCVFAIAPMDAATVRQVAMGLLTAANELEPVS